MTKDEFYDTLQTFFVEQASINSRSMKEKDKVYQDLKKVSEEKNKEFYSMIKEFDLNHKKEKITEDFVSAIYDYQFYENMYQYLKGYRDCFKLLSYIGLFNDFSDFFEANEY